MREPLEPSPIRNPNIMPPHMTFCNVDDHEWHCEDESHLPECYCIKCDYWKRWHVVSPS